MPGVYTVTELVPAGWDLTGLVCVDNTGGTTVDLGNATATVTLDPGDAVVCTFTDTKRGSITIVKEDVSTFDNLGDGDDFAFTGDLGAFTLDDPDVDDADGITDTFAVANLLPGVYAITETLVPDDNPLDLDGPWALGEIVCTGADAVAADATITITLDPGEDAECIFRNLQTEIIPPPFIIGDFVWNDVNDNGLQDPGEIGIGGVAVDLLDTSSTVLASTVTDAAGKYSFAVADPGTYVLRFTTPFDFDITDALVGIDPAVDSNLLPNGLTPEVEVTIADMLGVGSNLTIDAGFVRIPEIPETGADTDRLAGLAGVLLLGGILLLVLSRRRRSTI